MLVFISPACCRAREALRSVLPDQLKGDTFDNCLEDRSVRTWLSMLLKTLEDPTGPEQGMSVGNALH